MFNLFQKHKRKYEETTMDRSKELKPDMEGLIVNQRNNAREQELLKYVRSGSKDELDAILANPTDTYEERQLALNDFVDKMVATLRELRLPLRARTLSKAMLELAELDPNADHIALAPVQLFPARLAPVQLFPARLAPVELFPGRLAPVELFPGRLAPVELFPDALYEGENESSEFDDEDSLSHRF